MYRMQLPVRVCVWCLHYELQPPTDKGLRQCTLWQCNHGSALAEKTRGVVHNVVQARHFFRTSCLRYWRSNMFRR